MKRSPTTLPLALMIPVALIIGLVIGAHPAKLPGFVRDALGVHDSDTTIQQAIDIIHDDYYRKIPRDQLADKAIGGIVKSLGDQFSNYFDPKAYKRFKENQDAAFAGVGMVVAKDPLGLRVTNTYDGSPARRAGVKRGDIVIKAAGDTLKGMNEDAAVALIRGEPGTDVTIVVRRDGKQKSLTLTRAKIDVPVVASRTVDYKGKKYGLIGLAQFTSGARAEVASAVRRAISSKDAGIVFDLRGNPGGLVTEAQLVASIFIEHGEIVTTRGRNSPEQTLNATGDAIAPKIPLVVLVDRDSASAAEIVSGALQDDKRAKLVGSRTFGKGVFQEVIDLDNGGALDITAGQYFTPSGRNLGGNGVKTGIGLLPDIKAPDDPKTKGVDETLQRALKSLQ